MRPFSVLVHYVRMAGLQIVRLNALFPTFTTIPLTVDTVVTKVTQSTPRFRSNINYLQLFPILIAFRRWGPWWLDNRVIAETDNTKAMAFVSNGMCGNPIAMHGCVTFSG